jgi:hypothetical protein
MPGKFKQFWHRYVDRKPWVFRDSFGIGYLCTPQDGSVPGSPEAHGDSALLAYLPTAVKPGQLFVDLSPQIGAIALLAAKQVQDHGAVFAFTPDPKAYRQLVNNVALNRLTQCVRVIGRDVLAQSAAVSYTLDDFATSWHWGAVDFMRLAGARECAALETSAADLFKSRRVQHILLDQVEAAALPKLLPVLQRLGFEVHTLNATGQLQPLGASVGNEPLNIIASLR